jgi:hypothetical protein
MKDAPLLGLLLALPTNICPGRKILPETNTLAYWYHVQVMKNIKCFEYGHRQRNSPESSEGTVHSI